MTRYAVTATWDDVPHLSEEDKKNLLLSYPPHERDVRSRGVVMLGSGVVWPVRQEDYLIDPIELPLHWKFAFGLDIGWNRTAAIWGALDTDADCWYLYSEHYVGQREPAVHAEAIRARGDWVPGIIDSAARGRSEEDGNRIYDRYRRLGLNLTASNKRWAGKRPPVEASVFEIWERLTSGRLKVFKTLVNLLAEMRIYRRDVRGHIVQENDHAVDAMRYLIMDGAKVAVFAQRRRGRPGRLHRVEYNPYAIRPEERMA